HLAMIDRGPVHVVFINQVPRFPERSERSLHVGRRITLGRKPPAGPLRQDAGRKRQRQERKQQNRLAQDGTTWDHVVPIVSSGWSDWRRVVARNVGHSVELKTGAERAQVQTCRTLFRLCRPRWLKL